jgi:hypothetical protein
MHRYPRTTTPIRKQGPGWYPGGVLAVFLTVAVAASLILAFPSHDNTPTGTVHTTDAVDPVVITPEPTPTAVPLTLVLDLPQLSDMQRKWVWLSLALPRNPQAFGLDHQPVPFTDNEAVMFAALIGTESSWNPYNEDFNRKRHTVTLDDGRVIECGGVAQLCGSLYTDITANSDEENLYAGAAEFKFQLDKHGGDFDAALDAYKGVASADARWQSETVWSYVRLRGGR